MGKWKQNLTSNREVDPTLSPFCTIVLGVFWRTVIKCVNVWCGKIWQNSEEIYEKKEWKEIYPKLWQFYPEFVTIIRSKDSVYVNLCCQKYSRTIQNTWHVGLTPIRFGTWGLPIFGSDVHWGPVEGCEDPSLNKDKFFMSWGSGGNGVWGPECSVLLHSDEEIASESPLICFRLFASFVLGLFKALHISSNVSLIIFRGSAKVQFSTPSKMPSLKNPSFIESFE